MVTFASVVVVWATLSTSVVVDPLHEAARTNDVPRIRQLLAGRMLGLVPGFAAAELNAPGYGRNENRTPLMVAAEAGALQAVEELLRRGADPTVELFNPDLGPMSARCYALLNDHGAAMARTFEAQAQQDPRHWPPEANCVDDVLLVAAVRHGSNDEVEFQLRSSPSDRAIAYALDQSIGDRGLDQVRPQLVARLTDRFNLKAVQTAVSRGDVLGLTQLADAHAQASSDYALRPLALIFADHTRAQLLLQLRRITTLTTGQVSSLAWDALNRDHLETLEALRDTALLRVDPLDDSLEKQAQLAVWKKGDEAAMALALTSRDPQRAVRTLLALGVELATGAAVAQAAEVGDCETAEVLSEAGAELNQVDESCRTPLEIARVHGHWDLARALEKATARHPRLANPGVHCADTVERDPKERSPLRCPGWR